MRIFGFIFLALTLFSYGNIKAQNTNSNCPCCIEIYNEFDFWLGEWEVYDVNNKLVGTNSITKQYNNCVIEEKWVSTGKNKGTSTNFYNKTDGSWNQIWVDNSGFNLKLTGNFIKGSMVLKSDLIKGKNGSFYNQMSWTKNQDDSVLQLWETFDLNNNKISEVFRGIYKKKLN